MGVAGQGDVPRRRGLKIAGALSFSFVIALGFLTYPHQSKAQEGHQIPQGCAKFFGDYGTLNAGGLDCTGMPRAQCAI